MNSHSAPRKTRLAPALVFIAGCFASQAATLVIPPARAQDQRRYDYQCADVSNGSGGYANGMTSYLKQYGAQGWKLVAIEGAYACFERPL